MRFVELPDGSTVPTLGLGTWRLGESAGRRARDVAAVRSAIDLGYRLIDTAEMYGDGGAEEVVGQAVADALRSTASLRRESLFIVSKVYPHNASRRGTVAACERSLRRLGTDRIDLYLLHWRGAFPLQETVDAMRSLVDAGKIGRWGVSNFDVDDMQELAACDGGAVAGAAADTGAVNDAAGSPPAQGCATNQVYYSVGERGPEFALLPWMRQRRLPLMAYSPIDQGRIADDRVLAGIAAARGISAAQLALAWVCSQPGVIAVPKASSVEHLRENLAAADIELGADERQQVDRHFPPPSRKTPLAMI